MANVKLVVNEEQHPLQPGTSKKFKWNHTHVGATAFAFSVLPWTASQNSPAIDKLPARAEIRNVSYKFFNAIAGVQVEELEVHFELHNIEETRIYYRVYMAQIGD